MFFWLKEKLRLHFSFSRAEANGVLVLLIVLSCCLVVPQGIKHYYRAQPEGNLVPDVALLERTLGRLGARRQPSTPGKNAKHASPHDVDRSAYAFDINTADASQLRTIAGIGPTLSVRIVKFRDQLGGFVSLAQYQEVYGLQPEVVDRLKRCTYIDANFQPIQLNINTATIPTLSGHPYVTPQLARSIFRYRQQHGPFASVASLGDLVLMDRITLEKLAPYLAIA